MPALPDNQADIIFDITEGNLRDSFDIVKRYVDGMTVGECQDAGPWPVCRRRKLLDQLGCPLRPCPESASACPSGPGWHPNPSPS